MNRRSFLARLGGTFAALATGAIGFEKLVEEAIPADAFASICPVTAKLWAKQLEREILRPSLLEALAEATAGDSQPLVIRISSSI